MVWADRGYVPSRFKACLPYLLWGIIVTLISIAATPLLPFYIIAMMFYRPLIKAMEFLSLETPQENPQVQVDNGWWKCFPNGPPNVWEIGLGVLLLPLGVLYGVFVAPVDFYRNVYRKSKELLL